MDQSLIDQMDAEDRCCQEIWSKYNWQIAKKLIFSCRALMDSKKKIENFSSDDFKLIDSMVVFCQFPFRDRESTDAVLDVLTELYNPLISHTAKQFSKIDYEEAKDIARRLFRRLITGDMPETINAYRNSERGVTNRTREMQIDLSDKRVPDLVDHFYHGLDALLSELKACGLTEHDLSVIESSFEYEKRHFHEFATLSSTRITPEQYARQVIEHEFEVTRRLIENGTTEKVRKESVLKASLIKEQILSSDRGFQEFYKKHKGFFDSLFEKKKKWFYRNNYFNQNKELNFTSYIKNNLRWALGDVFKSKPYKKSCGYGECEVGGSHLKPRVQNESTNILERFLDQYPIDFDCALKKMTVNEQKVIKLLREGYKQNEIADKMGVSEARITQYKKKSIEKLKKYLL